MYYSSLTLCCLICVPRRLDFPFTFSGYCCSGFTSVLSVFFSTVMSGAVLRSRGTIGAVCFRPLLSFFVGFIDFLLIVPTFSPKFFFDYDFVTCLNGISSPFSIFFFALICVGPAMPATVWRSCWLAWNITWLKYVSSAFCM